MRKLSFFAIILIALLFTGCQRSCNAFNRGFQASERKYHIIQYSGGQVIAEYQFVGIVDNQENSDGYYFYYGDQLVEMSGDIIIRSTDK